MATSVRVDTVKTISSPPTSPRFPPHATRFTRQHATSTKLDVVFIEN